MKTVVQAILIVSVITGMAFVFSNHGGADTAIDQFIGSLQYNPKTLLSLKSTRFLGIFSGTKHQSKRGYHMHIQRQQDPPHRQQLDR